MQHHPHRWALTFAFDSIPTDLPSNEELSWWIGNYTKKENKNKQNSLSLFFENWSQAALGIWKNPCTGWLADARRWMDPIHSWRVQVVTVTTNHLCCDKENIACKNGESRWPAERERESRQLMYVHLTWTYPLYLLGSVQYIQSNVNMLCIYSPFSSYSLACSLAVFFTEYNTGRKERQYKLL